MLRGRHTRDPLPSLRNSDERNDELDRRVSLRTIARFTNFNTASAFFFFFFPAVIVIVPVRCPSRYCNWPVLASRRLILITRLIRIFVPLLRVPRTNNRNRRIYATLVTMYYICTRVTRILRISPQHRETDSIMSIIYVSIMITSLLSVE